MVAALSKATMQQLATAARHGNNKSLGDLLTALTLGGGYATYAGDPNSNLTPDRIGEYCFDTTHKVWYRATGLANTNWVVQSIRSSASFEVFDDFLAAALDATDNWIVFAGTDGAAVIAATVTAPEGKVDMKSAAAGSTEDGSVMSLILLAKGSLVSLGMTIFECRVSFDQITGVTACFGLSDKLADDNEHLLHTIIAGTVADGGLTVTDTVEFVYSEEATLGTLWHAASENNSTIGNSGAEETLVDGPTIDAYDILRLEVDADGTARFYINSVLRLTRANAVRTTALLIPYIAIDGEAATPVATVLSIDYIRFSGARPAGQ